MSTPTLPRHPVTGLSALGWRKARPGETGSRPIWPVLGGSTPPEPDPEGDPKPDPEPSPGPDPEPEPEPPADLGDAGKRALAAMKKERDEAKRQAREASAKVAEFEDRDKSELQRATERATAAEERAAAASRREVAARVEALASRKVGDRAPLADPTDAVGALDLAKYTDTDGAIDADAIEADLVELLARKPHWALPAGAPPPKVPKPDPGQGPRPGGQLGSLDDQIRTAEQAGDWGKARRLKSQKLAELPRN